MFSLAGLQNAFLTQVGEEDKAKKQLENAVEKLQNEVKGHQQRLEEAKDQLNVCERI